MWRKMTGLGSEGDKPKVEETAKVEDEAKVEEKDEAKEGSVEETSSLQGVVGMEETYFAAPLEPASIQAKEGEESADAEVASELSRGGPSGGEERSEDLSRNGTPVGELEETTRKEDEVSSRGLEQSEAKPEEKEEKKISEDKSPKLKDGGIEEGGKEKSEVVDENDAELLPKEKDDGGPQSNIPGKEEKAKKKEKSHKGDDTKKEKSVDNNGAVVEDEKKKKEKKEKKEKKGKSSSGKNSSERIQGKLDKIDGKIARILARKETYTSQLKEAKEREAKEREQKEAEITAQRDLEAARAKSSSNDTGADAKEENVTEAQAPSEVETATIPTSTEKKVIEPFPPNFKEELTQKEIALIQSVKKR